MHICPIDMPVSVTAYVRRRRGQFEHVRAHCRHQPKR
ncbi:MAG: hypothetical protein K0Q68_638 [Moraxellaceae bacterium]|jgi:hypothetical protein|nr:hypothetical protein [Moraxellaceae bacterium]